MSPKRVLPRLLARFLLMLAMVLFAGLVPAAAVAQPGGEEVPSEDAVSADLLQALGIPQPVGMDATEASQMVAQQVAAALEGSSLAGADLMAAGLPTNMAANAAFSAAVMVALAIWETSAPAAISSTTSFHAFVLGSTPSRTCPIQNSPCRDQCIAIIRCA